MPRRASAAAALLACAAAAIPLAGCSGDGLEVRGAAPDSSAAGLTEITGCSGRSARAPSRLTIRCTAPRAVLDDLRWHGWGGRTATATGTLVTGVCAAGDPSCSDVALVTASHLVLGTRADQYKALTVQSGTGADRVTTRFDVDDRGPTTR